MQNDTRIAVDVAKAVFEVAVSDRPGAWLAASACRGRSSCPSSRSSRRRRW